MVADVSSKGFMRLMSGAATIAGEPLNGRGMNRGARSAMPAAHVRATARFAAVAALSLLATVATTAASAQSSGTPGKSWWDTRNDPSPSTAPPTATPDSAHEVLLGTITTGRPSSADRGDVADQILADGLDALRRGDVMLGRRRLEAVIDAYPDSPAAFAARRELAALYSIPGRNSPTSGATPPSARWIPAQNSAQPAGPDVQARNVGATEPDNRGTLAREARARERQSRRDERVLRALSFEFQMQAGDRVFFAESSVELGARARGVLSAQARWLGRYPDLPLVIEAHADDDNARDLDIQLSEQRARAVQERLVAAGVDPARISITAFGRDRPVATCRSPECAAQNRRVITRVGGLPDLDAVHRSVEEPALAIAPSRAAPSRRD